jgi:hypothetical protein
VAPATPNIQGPLSSSCICRGTSAPIPSLFLTATTTTKSTTHFMNLIYLIQELRLHVAVALLIVEKRVFFVLSLKEVTGN